MGHPTGIPYLCWSDVDPASHAFTAAPARALAERFVAIGVDVLAGDRSTSIDAPPARERIEDELDGALLGEYGAWMAGWRWASSEPGGGGPVRAWCCAEHSFLPDIETEAETTERELPSLTVDRIEAAVKEWRAFLVMLGALFAELPDPRGGSAARDVEHAAARLLPLVLARTSAEDAWYATFTRVLTWFLESKGHPREAVAPHVEEVVSGRFHSWITPDPAVVKATCRELGERFVAERAAPTGVDATAEWLAIRESAFSLFTPRERPPVARGDAHRRFIDGPEHARDPVRAGRMRTALELARAWAASAEPLGQSVLGAWAGAVHGTAALPFRDAEARAKGGREVYPAAGARERFERCLEEANDESVSVSIRAARLFLDICFFHPFADGNARVARLAVDALLSRAGLALVAIEPLVCLSRAANDPGGAWYCAYLIDHLTRARPLGS